MSNSRTYCIPFVGAIVEKEQNGVNYVLVQTRQQKGGDPKYNGTLEIPQGTMDVLYENVFDCLSREIREETGLVLDEIVEGHKSEIYSPQGDDATFGFRPYYCVQMLKGGRPWVGFIFRCKVVDGQPKAQEDEVCDVRWMEVAELKEIIEKRPQDVFTLDYAALRYYTEEVLR